MGVLEGVRGGGVGVAEAVEAAEVVPVEDLVERPLGCGGDSGGRVDQPSGAAGVAEIDGGEVFWAQSRPALSSMTSSVWPQVLTESDSLAV